MRVPCAILALATFGAEARAVAFGTAPVSLDLGGGLRVHRVPVACAPTVPYGFLGNRCAAWSAEGLSVPAGLPLGAVHNFAAARGGRVAMATATGVWLSDDRGDHWVRARIDEPLVPYALAFDPDSDFGAAVGPVGTVWTTEDRGLTWRSRRDRAGAPLVDVAVTGRTVAFSDAVGGVWVSTDGGFGVRTLAEVARAALPVMALYRGVIWIRLDGRRWWRADARGTLEESDRSPWTP